MPYKKNLGEKWVKIPIPGYLVDAFRVKLRDKKISMRVFFAAIIKKFLDNGRGFPLG